MTSVCRIDGAPMAQQSKEVEVSPALMNPRVDKACPIIHDGDETQVAAECVGTKQGLNPSSRKIASPRSAKT